MLNEFQNEIKPENITITYKYGFLITIKNSQKYSQLKMNTNYIAPAGATPVLVKYTPYKGYAATDENKIVWVYVEIPTRIKFSRVTKNGDKYELVFLFNYDILPSVIYIPKKAEPVKLSSLLKERYFLIGISLIGVGLLLTFLNMKKKKRLSNINDR